MEFFKIPDFLKREHETLHEELVIATKDGGRTGKAAQAVAKLMHPHFINSLLKKACFPLSCCWHSAGRESDAWVRCDAGVAVCNEDAQ